MTKLLNISFLRKMVAGFVAVAIIFLSVFYFAPSAKAQTAASDAQLSAMMAQIQQLMQILSTLQARLAAMHGSGSQTGLEGGFTNYGFSIGDRVQTTDTLKVRSWAEPGADLIGVQNPFAGGEITGGPQTGGGYTWWRVAYDNGMGGWSAQNWLRKNNPTYLPPEPKPEPVEPAPTPEPLPAPEPIPDYNTEEPIDDDELITGEFRCDSKNLCTKVDLDNELFTIDNEGVSYEYVLRTEAVEFEFELEIEAIQKDLYIAKDSFLAMVSVGEKADFMYDEEVEENLFVMTTADTERIDGDYYYVVEAGDSHEFDLVLYYDPVVAANYVATFYGFDFMLEDSEVYKVDLYPNRLESDFIAIGGMSQAEWSGADNTTELEQTMEALLAQLAVSSSRTNPTAAELAEQATNLAEQIGGTKEDEYKDRIDDLYPVAIPLSHAVIEIGVRDYGELGTYDITVDGVKVDSNSLRKTTRTAASEKCMDVLMANLAAEVSCRYNQEPIYDTRELTKGGQPKVDLISSDVTYIENATDPERNTVEFEIGFEVTAKGADVFVPAIATMIGDQSDRHTSVIVGPNLQSWLFQIEGELSGLIDPDDVEDAVSATIESNAERIGSTGAFYRVNDGDTERLTLTVNFDPVETDEYRMKFGNYIRYYLYDPNDTQPTGNYMIFFLDTDDFRTSYEFAANEAAPETNHFACNRNNDGQYSNGEVACYGVWDYGNSFGNDHDMCGAYSDYELGCVIDAPVCESGSAQATGHYSNSELKKLSSSAITTIANNLDTSTVMVQQEMAGLWEYECVPAGTVQGASTTNLSQQVATLMAALSQLVDKIAAKR